MPHCIVEYSKGLEQSITPALLLDSVYQGALNTGLFIDSDIKSRVIVFEHYQTGKEKSEFIHIVVKILSGRTQNQKSQLSASILEKIKNTKLKLASITVEVQEIDKETYSKEIVR